MAKDIGYVTTLWGRRRRLPDMQLPEYDFVPTEKYKGNNNPLNFNYVTKLPVETVSIYSKILSSAKNYKSKQKSMESLKAKGIKIIDNSKKIADATRQCVNARIQGRLM